MIRYETKERPVFFSYEKLEFMPHLHRAAELGLVASGESELYVDGRLFSLRAGDLFIIFPDQIHSYRNDRSVSGLLFILPEADLAPFGEIFAERCPQSPVLSLSGEARAELTALFRRIFFDREKEGEAVMRGWFHVLVGKLLSHLPTEHRTAPHAALPQVLLWLRDHITEDVSRKSLARAVGLSESTVSHLFSKALGLSLPAYVAGLRLELALTLREREGITLTEAALRAGFGSLRSFHRAYRQKYGK